MQWVPCSFGNFKSGDLWLALITFLYVSLHAHLMQTDASLVLRPCHTVILAKLQVASCPAPIN